MQKIILKWWKVSIFLMLGAIYFWGVKNMYFHQDDLDWFMMANRPFWQVIAAPLSDHINYIFRVLLKVEWDNFHLFFPGYLAVSVLLHTGVIALLYQLVKLTTGRRDLAVYSALLFTINTNWTEVVLWSSGQTISISALFVLLALQSVWKAKNRSIWIFLSSFTSALALGMIPATLLTDGIDYKKRKLYRVGFAMILISAIVLLFYKFVATDGTQIEYSLAWGVRVIEVMVLGVVNTVIGRLVIPFDKYETIRIILVSLLLGYGLWRYRDKIFKLLKDKWSVFLLMQLFFYYLIVAIGRSQYGVGIMRAERYSYIGLALVLLLIARIIRNWQTRKWAWIVPCLVILQMIGLYRRAQDYIVRPQLLRGVVQEVQKSRVNVNPESYLPYEILNDERLKYSDLIKLIDD
ncbi:MAG: hypothetical protein WAV40_04450 [Microgenomates group bacterium]